MLGRKEGNAGFLLFDGRQGRTDGCTAVKRHARGAEDQYEEGTFA